MARSHSVVRLRGSLQRHRFTCLAFGLLCAILTAGVLLLVRDSREQSELLPEDLGYTVTVGQSFALWYRQDSEAIQGKSDVLAYLCRCLTDLLSWLEIDADRISYPIHVFVHDRSSDLQEAFYSGAWRSGFPDFGASIDVIVGEPMRPPLVEILLEEWGDCAAQAVYLGMLVYASRPEIDFLRVVAATPAEMRHSIGELFTRKGEYPLTAYQQFDPAHRADAPLSPEERRESYSLVTRVLAGEARESFRTMEMASLIQYLYETTGGLRSIKNAWNAQTTNAFLEQCSSEPLAALNMAWQSEIDARAVANPSSE